MHLSCHSSSKVFAKKNSKNYWPNLDWIQLDLTFTYVDPYFKIKSALKLNQTENVKSHVRLILKLFPLAGDTMVPGLGVSGQNIIPLITNLQATLKANVASSPQPSPMSSRHQQQQPQETPVSSNKTLQVGRKYFYGDWSVI